MRNSISPTRLLLLSSLVVTIGGCEEPTLENKEGHIQVSKPAVASAAKRATVASKRTPRSATLEQATALAKSVIIVDGHIDLPYRQHKHEKANEPLEHTTTRTKDGDFDAVRAKAGGLDAPFMSIYTPADLEDTGKSKAAADHLIDLVEQMAKSAPETYVLATSPADVRAAFAAKKIALPMGMENGSPIERKLENVKHFADRGIRYITLAHSKDNHISDSSYDERHTNKGLTPFGKKVIDEMNRLGVMVDVAHLSDDAVIHAVSRSKVPVIASHSSCRHYTPDFERNLSDNLIALIARKGGVVQINFGSTFISHKSRTTWNALREKLNQTLEAKKLKRGTKEGDAFVKAFYDKNKGHYATVSDVADHIQHVADLVGVRHVGFGSDFDGVGDSLPVGLKDVSMYPNLILELMKRGFSDEDIRLIAGENVLRVWSDVERFAKDSAKKAADGKPTAKLPGTPSQEDLENGALHTGAE